MVDQDKNNINVTQRRRDVLGEKFLITFYRLISIVKIYDSNNDILISTVNEYTDLIGQCVAEKGELTIRASRGHFFLYDEKLIYHRENLNVIREMLDFFELRLIPGLRFTADVSDVKLEQVLTFGRIFNDAIKEQDPLNWFKEKIEESSFKWVELAYLSDTILEDNSEELKEIARKTYSYALSSVKEVSRKIATQNSAGVRKLKRIVQNMVEFISEDASVLLGMSTVREYDDYTYTHSVNVAILSLCLGKRIGLPRIPLSWLGICGMVHDLGKLDIPHEILNKPGKLTAGEFEKIEKHPLKSVSQVLKLKASRDLKAKILLPPLEHHMKYDFSGYPRVRRNKSISLFGRIITIADVFDALSSPRVYRPTALSPDKVLGMMTETSGKDFDPILLKVFINMLGIYPVGTFLVLDTGEKGLVASQVETRDITRPKVVLLEADGQGGYKKVGIIDLAEQNPKTGRYVRNIVETHHPSEFRIQPAALIM